jgi:hypothetical protein
VCAEGVNQNTGTHGLMHTYQSASAAKCPTGNIPMSSGGPISDKQTTYGDAKTSAIEAFHNTFPDSDCDDKCLAAQLDAYHKDECKIDDKTKIKAVETGQDEIGLADQAVYERSERVAAAKAAGEF